MNTKYSNLQQKLQKTLRYFNNFPVDNVTYIDIYPLSTNMELYNLVIDTFVEHFKDRKINKVVAIESEGYTYGISIAQKLNVPFIPIRKKKKVPYSTVSVEYKMNYRSIDSLQVESSLINEKDNILLIDNFLATGTTIVAAIDLIQKLKGNIIACAFVIELAFLNGKDKIKDGIESFSILQVQQ